MRTDTRLVDEMLDHLLGDLEVVDHAVSERPEGLNVVRRLADDDLGVGAYCPDASNPIRGLDRNNGRLVDHDPLSRRVDKGIGGPKVHCDGPGPRPEVSEIHRATP